MWKVLACILAAGIGVFAQSGESAKRLNPVLERAMTGNSGAEELAGAMVSLAPVARRVPRHERARLAMALTAMGIVDPGTDLIVRRFLEVGGPDDYPAKPNRRLQLPSEE
jgi:hypothetical protein